MTGEDERVLVLYDVAVSLLPEGDNVHVYRNPTWGLVGIDAPREDVLEMLRDAPEIHLTGDHARALKHGLAIMVAGRWLYLETDAAKLDALFPPMGVTKQ